MNGPEEAPRYNQTRIRYATDELADSTFVEARHLDAALAAGNADRLAVAALQRQLNEAEQAYYVLGLINGTVPTAGGEPEVLPLIHINPAVLGMLRGETKRAAGGLTYSMSSPMGGWTVPLYEQHVVTLLQAEVERLKLRCKRREEIADQSDREATDLLIRANGLQSELTKARAEAEKWEAVARDFAARRDELKQELDVCNGQRPLPNLSNADLVVLNGLVAKNYQNARRLCLRASTPVKNAEAQAKLKLAEDLMFALSNQSAPTDKGQDPNKADRLAVAALQRELNESRDRVYELEHAIFHALDDSLEEPTEPGDVTITKMDFDKLNALLPEDWEHRGDHE